MLRNFLIHSLTSFLSSKWETCNTDTHQYTERISWCYLSVYIWQEKRSTSPGPYYQAPTSPFPDADELPQEVYASPPAGRAEKKQFPLQRGPHFDDIFLIQSVLLS